VGHRPQEPPVRDPALQPASRRRHRRSRRGPGEEVANQMIKNLPLRHKLPGTRAPHRGSNPPGPWTETMAGGSPAAERLEFDRLARDIMLVQLKNQKTASAHRVPHPGEPTGHGQPAPA